MPTRNVVLTDHQSALIDRLVKSGRYQNASEVLREGLRLIEREDAEARARIKALREAANVGIAAVDAGRIRTFASVDELDDHYTTLTEEALTSDTERKRTR